MKEAGGAASKQAARAAIAGVYRRLAVSATVGAGPDGKPTVVPLDGRQRREYWVVRPKDGKSGLPVFVVVAVGAAGAGVGVPPSWLDGVTPPPPGQPLLSPADGQDTTELAKQYGLTSAGANVPSSWPANLGALSARK